MPAAKRTAAGLSRRMIHLRLSRRDRERDRALTRAGWQVLRFTWRDLTRSPAAVADEVRGRLAADPLASRAQ